jgi:uncharacterized membrane protein
MENKDVKVSSIKTIDIVQVALMTAMAFVVTMFTQIPYGHNAVVHLGDAVVFIAALMFGKKKGFIAAALGMFLFDLSTAYAIWAPITFIAKGMMAYIAGAIAFRKDYEGDNLFNNILACILGGIFMIAAYYVGGVIIDTFILASGSSATVISRIYANMTVGLVNIPGNIIQVVVGTVIAIPLVQILKRSKVLTGNKR